MQESKLKTKTIESAPSMVVVVVLLLVGITMTMMLERLYVERISFAEQEVNELRLVHTEQLELFVEQSNLLTTLASALLGALGAVALKTEGLRINKGALVLLGSAVVLSACSLYFGYLSYQEVLWMLHSEFFNLEEQHIAWVRRLQFFSFLGSAFCAALFIASLLSSTTQRAVT